MKKILLLYLFFFGIGCTPPKVPDITVASLLTEMTDFETLAQRPVPFYKTAMASSYSRKSREGGSAWFDNADLGQYIRTETVNGHREHVLADLKGPGAVTRFWTANPAGIIKFYFDGEKNPRIETPLTELFGGRIAPFDSAFAYTSGTGKNLYFPIPYHRSLKISLQETEAPISLYYEINYRSYLPDIIMETFDPRNINHWTTSQENARRAFADPTPVSPSQKAEWLHYEAVVAPQKTLALPQILGEKAVYEWNAQVADLKTKGSWEDPLRADQALRALTLLMAFDGERSVLTPLGDFFGSAPGINSYQNLFFTVDASGKMTSRLLMPFKKSMDLSLTNHGKVPYKIAINLRVGPRPFSERDYHLRAQWKAVTRETWPSFDTSILNTTGEGKVVGTSYGIANPVLIWWGEGDQKIFVDGETFPSTFGSGTEDDYGFAYGYNKPFVRPYHAQTRVDGPASGGHISLNRWYVLDAYPYTSQMTFDQEIWHWMPTNPTWSHTIYWYAKPGSPGPEDINPKDLPPRDLGDREKMFDPIDGETLRREATGGVAETQRLANCLRAEHLFWHHAEVGDKLTLHIPVAEAGRYQVNLNLAMAPDYGRHRFFVNDKAATTFDGYAPSLSWRQPDLGLFDLKKGDNTLTVETLGKNPQAIPGNFFGLDYVFLVKQ